MNDVYLLGSNLIVNVLLQHQHKILQRFLSLSLSLLFLPKSMQLQLKFLHHFNKVLTTTSTKHKYKNKLVYVHCIFPYPFNSNISFTFKLSIHHICALPLLYFSHCFVTNYLHPFFWFTKTNISVQLFTLSLPPFLFIKYEISTMRFHLQFLKTH